MKPCNNNKIGTLNVTEETVDFIEKRNSILGLADIKCKGTGSRKSNLLKKKNS